MQWWQTNKLLFKIEIPGNRGIAWLQNFYVESEICWVGSVEIGKTEKPVQLLHYKVPGKMQI